MHPQRFRPHLLALAAVPFGLAAAGHLAADDLNTNPIRTAPSTTPAADDGSNHSWELPAITIPGAADSPLREEDRVGTYGQPRWTARRRFAETRVYVIPEGQIQLEYWLIVKDRKRGDKDGTAKVQQVYEVEMGLPYRFQLDLYQVWEKEGGHGPTELAETKFEVRWALADWDVIWGNPTLYAEWVQSNNDYDHAEGKLLLGGEIDTAWHWGTNFVAEQTLGGSKELSLEMTNAISYTLADEKFSIGLEDKIALVSDDDPATEDETEILLGPTIQYRPLPQMHINVSAMAGLTDDSPVSKTVVVVGWEF